MSTTINQILMLIGLLLLLPLGLCAEGENHLRNEVESIASTIACPDGSNYKVSLFYSQSLDRYRVEVYDCNNNCNRIKNLNNRIWESNLLNEERLVRGAVKVFVATKPKRQIVVGVNAVKDCDFIYGRDYYTVHPEHLIDLEPTDTSIEQYYEYAECYLSQKYSNQEMKGIAAKVRKLSEYMPSYRELEVFSKVPGWYSPYERMLIAPDGKIIPLTITAVIEAINKEDRSYELSRLEVMSELIRIMENDAKVISDPSELKKAEKKKLLPCKAHLMVHKPIAYCNHDGMYMVFFTWHPEQPVSIKRYSLFFYKNVHCEWGTLTQIVDPLLYIPVWPECP